VNKNVNTLMEQVEEISKEKIETIRKQRDMCTLLDLMIQYDVIGKTNFGNKN
jgi:hypothetical protein